MTSAVNVHEYDSYYSAGLQDFQFTVIDALPPTPTLYARPPASHPPPTPLAPSIRPEPFPVLLCFLALLPFWATAMARRNAKPLYNIGRYCVS